MEAVRDHNPLVTTLDVNMPGMDGFAVAKRLREFSSTYLIMITALADEIDVVQGFEAGADDYLVKPFRPRELRARADSMLRRPRARFDTPTGWVEADEPQPVQEAREESGPRSPRATWPPARRAAAADAEPQRSPYQPPASRQSRCRRPVRRCSSRRPAVSSRRPAAPPVRSRSSTTPRPAPAGPGRLGPVQRAGPQRRDPGRHRRRRAVDLTRTEFDLLASLLSTGRRVRARPTWC